MWFDYNVLYTLTSAVAIEPQGKVGPYRRAPRLQPLGSHEVVILTSGVGRSRRPGPPLEASGGGYDGRGQLLERVHSFVGDLVGLGA